MNPTPGAADRDLTAPERITLADWRIEHDAFLDQAKALLSAGEFDRLLFDLRRSIEVRQAQREHKGVTHARQN